MASRFCSRPTERRRGLGVCALSTSAWISTSSGRVPSRVASTQEPAADLAVLLAIVSSLRNRPLPGKWVAFGEVGLAGEIRPAPRGQDRLKEAAKLGFTHALIPKSNAPRQTIKGIEVIALERVEQAVDQLRNL